MPPIINLKNGIDLPVMQQLALLPYGNNYHGSAFCTDELRYIYWIPGYGQALFYRYDTYTDAWTQLAAPPVTPTTAGYASDMTYCHVKNRIYLVAGGSTGFHYYDVNANIWSAALAVLPVLANAGAQTTHTCSAHHAAANDDHFYYTQGDGSSRKFYRYVASTNTWAELGTDIIPTTAPSLGARLIWGRSQEPDSIYLFRGNTSRIFYIYSISGNTMSPACEIKGTSATLAAGSISDFDHTSNNFFFIEANLRQINKVKLRLAADDSGTASAGAATLLTDASKAWEEDKWAGFHITITGGTGTGQTRRIKANTATSITPWIAFTTAPDATSTYEVKYGVFDYGTASAGAATTLTDSSKGWITNAYQYEKIKIIAGTGAGQERYIASNTATAITVTAAWTMNPDSTSVYEIIGWRVQPEAQVPFATSASYYGNTMATVRIKGLLFVYFSRKGTTGAEFFRWLSISP